MTVQGAITISDLHHLVIDSLNVILLRLVFFGGFSLFDVKFDRVLQVVFFLNQFHVFNFSGVL